MTEQTPVELPAGAVAEARAEELQHALNAAVNRNIALNVEVRIRDAEIARLNAEQNTEET